MFFFYCAFFIFFFSPSFIYAASCRNLRPCALAFSPSAFSRLSRWLTPRRPPASRVTVTRVRIYLCFRKSNQKTTTQQWTFDHLHHHHHHHHHHHRPRPANTNTKPKPTAPHSSRLLLCARWLRLDRQHRVEPAQGVCRQRAEPLPDWPEPGQVWYHPVLWRQQRRYRGARAG